MRLIDNDPVEQSPCIRNFCLNDDDVCLGCFRSLQEICEWSQADRQKRIIILQNAKQRRESAKAGASNRIPPSR